MQSGSGLCDWALENRPLDYAREIGHLVKCPITSSSILINCLRSMSVYTLLTAQSKGKV